MDSYYADLHIHIGRTKTGRAVKITGAKTLTLQNVLKVSRERKGLDMIGIIDCHSPEVIEEIEELMEAGTVSEHSEGGLQYGATTFIPGSEIEIYDGNSKGPIHVLAYFPTLSVMKQFSAWMSGLVTNINLSSQRIYCDAKTLQQTVKAYGGLFIPAHVFTPFKSLYGKGVTKSLEEVFDPALIDGVELGLSSDTQMADAISELNGFAYLTNSDTHSLGKIAREYQEMKLEQPNFIELEKALQEVDGRKIIANFGLNPRLGKYHRTVCSACLNPVEGTEGICLECGSNKLIKGVATRIKELSDSTPLLKKRERPPYIHQVPLEFIPGLGPKTLERLLDAFGTEMDILHRVSLEQLKAVVPEKIAGLIDLARKGNMGIEAGGGGKYGKVTAGLDRKSKK
ncbi:endonuclease Q family protein [Peribacillus glennii]|uniref:TIGR00375 family protein n=1 Tax=Peribacillus glennii TaxID=2303991 RepID=A0A372LI10_9BACI|nr:endonuclease Q family protein [Peribacillus glennii]RFU65612.1 TIGR00375 family protein [Peribacillus glennii]